MWLGSAASGKVGFPAAGEAVSERQMVALFGEGWHPNADAIAAGLVADGRSVPTVLAATRLGAAYRTEAGRAPSEADWRSRTGSGTERPGSSTGGGAGAGAARRRTDLARVMFSERHGRGPVNGAELAGFVARVARPAAAPVAGYDLTFTPVKGVSALWAIAPTELAEAVERAHQDAVSDVLGWLERQAGYTRLGRDGVRQVQVRGLLAVAFTHRDSRSGDPNLHTHVAVSNRVQTLDGRWRALDGRPLHALATAPPPSGTTPGRKR